MAPGALGPGAHPQFVLIGFSRRPAAFLRDSHNYPIEMGFRLEPHQVDSLVAYMVRWRAEGAEIVELGGDGRVERGGRGLLELLGGLLDDLLQQREHGILFSGGGRAPGAHLVKACNTTGYETMLAPDFGGHQADLFICGDDPAARLTDSGIRNGANGR